MEELIPCEDCSCSCKLITDVCLVQNSEIPDASIVSVNKWNNATDDVGDLIGLICADELCQAVKTAAEAPTGSVLDNLPQKWKDVVTNRHFKKWYAERVSYHWFEGASISELKAVGLITTNNDDEEFKNNFTHADETERKRLQDAAANYASGARKRFLETFWNCNFENYDCRPDCCSSDESNEPPIGMVII